MSRFPTCEGTTKEGLPCAVAKYHRGPCRKTTYRNTKPVSDAMRAGMDFVFRERPAPTHLGVYDPSGPYMRGKFEGRAS